ncbi:DUF6279 family lipoprotein [Ramlibacter tataouinensis]|uniref:Lipoprotein n=1 Tax=Ramlibacter tataouinensis (strain ATCC BAA-407 / DSM 14655 / LMG 21543 / TTB310) TaxID=365046 RepID=F5XXN0_RAMTT|nr:DUF6279 family lipoprotein [Ramlibacter tataouinensis]AEG91833.1 Conserved hypothetical protein [Ramlibacter tataouinensis TTB310]
MTTFKLRLRIIGLLALCLALAACSAVKLSYNNLDEVAYWWLDGYLDFDTAQASRVRGDIARLHLWHRETELPRVEELLQGLERLAPGEVTAAQACDLFEQARKRLLAVAERAEPAIVTLALSLTPDQLQHLERRYARNNQEYRREWLRLPPGERLDQRLERIVERSERVYGRLEEPQLAVLRRQLAQSVFDPQRILAERQRRQQDMLQTLRQLQAPGLELAQARGLMRGYFERVQSSPDAAWRAHQEALTQEGCRSFAAGHNATTPAQRETAVQRLRGWQRDLRELARNGAPARG